ncbi:hypothetical protein ANO14919_122370 [Xylariales sp. No.14919]|nr:hypothetical protein ANO14919_122370 [Xylariales sp. No.14919]
MPKLTKRWPYAETSTGRYRGRLEGKLECWDANGPARAIFNTELDTKIKDYIVNNLPESNTFIGFSLFMVGSSQLRTSPTVLLVSDDKPRRKAAFEAIKSSGILERYPGFHVAHCRLAAEFEDLQPMAGRKVMTQRRHRSPDTDCGIYISVSDPPGSPLLVHDHASGTLNGARATIGRLILRDGIAYGVTVAHVLADHGASFKSHQFGQSPAGNSLDSPDFETTAMDDIQDESDLEELCSVTSEGSKSAPYEGSDDDDSSPEHFEPNTDSPLPMSNSQLEETMLSAQSDGVTKVDTEKPTQCDEPSNCRGVAVVKHASSDADMMLLAVGSGLGKSFQSSMIGLRQFAESTDMPIDGDMDIVVGLLGKAPVIGRLSATAFHGQYGSLGFRKLYLARLSTPLRPGDSGSWVYARIADYERMVGIIVAGSPSTGAALILPGQTVRDYVLKHTG